MPAQVWTERFREWMAAHVLQSLVRLMGKAHQEVRCPGFRGGWNVDLVIGTLTLPWLHCSADSRI